MRIYHYHPDTTAYLGTSLADESPLEPGVFLIPAHATPEAPPAVAEHRIACFAEGIWSIRPDWRAVPLWSTTTREPVSAQLGETLEALGATPIEPVGAYLRWDTVNQCWQEDTGAVLAAARSQADSQLASLMDTAHTQIAILQDAVDLAMATPAETERLTRWKQYRVLLSRVTSQAGYPTTISWPAVPA
jgi:hypothetical protein